MAEVWVHGAAEAILICTSATPFACAQPQPRGDDCRFLLSHRRYAFMFLFPSQHSADIHAALQSPLHRVQFVRWLTGAARACTTTLFADTRQLALEVTRLRKRCHPWYALSLAAHRCFIPAWYTCRSKPRRTTSTQAILARLHERLRSLPPVEERPEQCLPHMARSCTKTLTRWL